jgi:VWFA-related protein
VTILVVDMVNTPFMDQSYAREQLLKYLASQVDDVEPTALMVLTKQGVRTIHHFTSQPKVLAAALRKVTGEMTEADKSLSQPVADENNRFVVPAPEGSLVGGDTIENIIGRLVVFARSGDLELDEMRRREDLVNTLNSFQHIAQSLAGVPGRKSMIWITGGFPFELGPSGTVAGLTHWSMGEGLRDSVLPTQSSGRNQAEINQGIVMGVATELSKAMRPVYDRTMQVLASANIAVYPVDARGLITYFGGTEAHSRYAALRQFSIREEQHRAAINTMENFAAATGGRAFYNRNDLVNAFHEAADDSRTYYHLGYYRDKKDAKPGWRKLEVKVAKPDIRVRARKGFLLTETTMVVSNSRQLDLTSAVQSPLDYTGIPLRVRWLGTAPGEGKTKVGFAVVTGGGSVTVDADNNNKLDLDVVAVAMKASGEAADQVGQTIGGNVDQAAITDLQTNGLTYENMFEVPPGTYTAKFVVRDNVTGRMGSVQAALKVD